MKDLTSIEKKVTDVTFEDLFELADEVAQKAASGNHPASQELIDSAAQKWEEDSRYAA